MRRESAAHDTESAAHDTESAAHDTGGGLRLVGLTRAEDSELPPAGGFELDHAVSCKPFEGSPGVGSALMVRGVEADEPRRVVIGDKLHEPRRSDSGERKEPRAHGGKIERGGARGKIAAIPWTMLANS